MQATRQRGVLGPLRSVATDWPSGDEFWPTGHSPNTLSTIKTTGHLFLKYILYLQYLFNDIFFCLILYNLYSLYFVLIQKYQLFHHNKCFTFLSNIILQFCILFIHIKMVNSFLSTDRSFYTEYLYCKKRIFYRDKVTCK